MFLETHRHKEPYKIAASIVAPSEIEEMAKDYNVEVVRIKNSHSAMMEATRDPKVLYVGGIWGGFIFSDFLFASDGMFTVGQILEMLALSGHRISKLDEELPRRHQHSIETPCPWESKGTVMRRAMEYSQKLNRQLIEGIKIFYDDDSVLILPHKEAPAFHIIGESSTNDKAVSLSKKFSALITAWQNEQM